MLKKYLLVAAAIICLVVGAVVIGGQHFFSDTVVEEGVIYISGDEIERLGYEQVVDSIVKPRLKYPEAFDIYAERLNLSRRIRSGRYELRNGMSTIEVVRMLKLGLESPTTLTFNNIRTIPQLAGRLAANIESDSLSVLRALQSPEMLRRYGFTTPEELLSIFIPNSYEVYWSTSPEKLVSRMNREYQNFWNKERQAKLKELKITKMEAITLASIVYEETTKEDEMPRVAGVYINRLKIGMRLQADPTVKYAVGDFAIKRVLHKHLKVDSPYNTYIYKGVPPTPIAMPSIAAIDAVLNYEKHNYLYFCARPIFDGYHNFARTLSEHNANARSYSKELNRRNIK